ncbi:MULTISPECIES: VOC family protein [Microbacterium]|jgi:catechol 2,3-dioxygenase-like lactoylglutathione lyase family enzyme|uniref:VOC family protein n=1 Tax=Microbacterium TaxID=33882 RepID=UPI0005695A0D|nr:MULTISPECIES: VOC family protein [Microbacterium]AVL96144.1 glyoxalase [Microbacterium sp. str. 'China']KYJ98107.1 glyoxalase [Microbacterium sp. CH1]MCT1394437.1 VOC family protein [Microbacterium sp. p3-SID338]MDH5132006.1 VOC family protein [Microbacterium sp. RD10]MDH5135731.1 VOC family protein [Microbacterium sp. RD11]
MTDASTPPSDTVNDLTNPPVPPGALLLELVPVPVTDIERAKTFYRDQLGFRLDVDINPEPGVRIVQLTPPGSACSITLAEGLPTLDMPPGTLRGLHLVVADIEASRAELVERGVEISEVEDLGGVFYAFFADPDGNTWCLQHMPWR